MNTKLLMTSLLAGSITSAFSANCILIDFGSVATADSTWNTGVTTDVADLNDDSGAATGIGLVITTTAGGAFADNTAVWVDGTTQGGSSDVTIYDDGIINAGTGDDNLILTFSGLDDTATYDLFAGGQTIASDFGANWTVTGGGTADTNFQDTDSYVSFTGLSTDGAGNLVLTMNDISNGRSPADGRNVGISELKLTIIPVPEPASSALLALGSLSLLARRRK